MGSYLMHSSYYHHFFIIIITITTTIILSKLRASQPHMFKVS